MISGTKSFLSVFLNGKFENRISLKGLSLISVHRILVVAETFLVVALASVVADITWQVFSPEESVVSNAIGQTSSTNQRSNSEIYAGLKDLHLFGQPLPEVSEQQEAIDPRNIPRSRLQARITGIISHPDQSRNLAIIESNRSEESYRIGDRIYRTSADIQMIYPDRVVVDNNGQQEALLLYPNEPDRSVRENPVPRAESVKEVREQLLANPQSLMELVSISPVRDDGELKGYRINPRKNPGLFHALGLMPNDLTVAINGFDLTNNQDAMQVFAELPGAQQVVLTIEREQQLVNIEISL